MPACTNWAVARFASPSLYLPAEPNRPPHTSPSCVSHTALTEHFPGLSPRALPGVALNKSLPGGSHDIRTHGTHMRPAQEGRPEHSSLRPGDYEAVKGIAVTLLGWSMWAQLLGAAEWHSGQYFQYIFNIFLPEHCWTRGSGINLIAVCKMKMGKKSVICNNYC